EQSASVTYLRQAIAEPRPGGVDDGDLAEDRNRCRAQDDRRFDPADDWLVVPCVQPASDNRPLTPDERSGLPYRLLPRARPPAPRGRARNFFKSKKDDPPRRTTS